MAKNDWYEAGEAIRTLVQDAVENQDFTQLSSTITNVINQTVGGFQDALRESLKGHSRYEQGEREKRPQDSYEKEAGRKRDDRSGGAAPGYGERTEDSRFGGAAPGYEERAENDRSGSAASGYGERTEDSRFGGAAPGYGERAENNRFGGAAPGYEKRTGYDQHGGAAENYRHRAEDARFSGQEAAERIRRNMEAKRQNIRPAVRTPGIPGLAAAWMLAAAGYGFGGMFGLALVILAVIGDATGLIPAFVCEILSVLTALSLFMGVAGSRRIGLTNRFRRYTAMLGNRTYCMLEELASGTGKKISYVRKDLKEMLRRGFFPEGHLDRKETCLITDNETYQQYLLTQQEADRRAVFGQQEKRDAKDREARADGNGRDNSYGSVSGEMGGTAKPGGRSGGAAGSRRDSGQKDEAGKTGPPRDSLDQECRELIEEGERYIAHIRECNNRIPGEEMSKKLDRLELVVTRIFREVERRPELAPDLRRMMSYYLPTTRKLIDAYCQFDEQPISGQNIDSTKREIESALDTINQAFENLLDGFFENAAWDISSDISVLHTMFAQEGLTGKDFPKS